MSGMNNILIEAFALPSGFQFTDSVAFVSDYGKSLLVNIKNGTTLILAEELLEQIIKKKPSVELQFLLIQRGFANVPDSNAVIDQNSCMTPKFMLIDMTNACNLKCRYCFRKPEEKKEILSEKMIDDILAFLEKYVDENNLDGLTIQPWGGEPMVAVDRILYLVDKSRKLGLNIDFSMETNGCILSAELAKKLKERNVSLGVSVDGDSVIHNNHRPFADGSESFDTIAHNIEILKEAGYDSISSITVVTRDTIELLDEVIDQLTKRIGFSDVKLNLMKGTKFNDHTLLLEEKDIKTFAEKLVDIVYRRYKNGEPFVEANVCEKMGNLLYRKGDNICISKGCSGGRELISINRKGEIFPCEMTDYPEEQLGTIYDNEPLKERIIRATEQNDYFKEKKKPECSHCAWWYYCRGGCSSAVKYEHDRICGVDENECRINKELYPLLVDIILNDPDIAEAIARGR